MLRISEPDYRRSPTELRRLIGQSSAGMTRILDKLEGDWSTAPPITATGAGSTSC